MGDVQEGNGVGEGMKHGWVHGVVLLMEGKGLDPQKLWDELGPDNSRFSDGFLRMYYPDVWQAWKTQIRITTGEQVHDEDINPLPRWMTERLNQIKR